MDSQSEKGFISLWRAFSNFRVEFEIGGRATHNAAPALPTITSNKGQYIKVVRFKYKSWNEAIQYQPHFLKIKRMEERTNLPENRVEGQQSAKKDHRLEDLAVIARWVKLELFDTVKFLYVPQDDLKIDGPLYNMWLTACKKRLVGLKLESASSQAYRRMYVESIWREATMKRNNIIADGLSARRSGVYSAMQNRFTGKCGGSDAAI